MSENEIIDVIISVVLCSLMKLFPFPLIVGQYDGRCKPLPEYHAKITGFDERVRLLYIS